MQHRYYVAAGSATVVVTREEGMPDEVAYLHTEALGSVDTITDGSGGVIQRLSYDAFGARRNSTWGQSAVGLPVPVDRTVGFTGQEGDDELGLVNMRGRIYDPGVGRFLTTDPLVARPGLTQSWNPYSYVWNSPLSFTDPSGFEGTAVADTGRTTTFPDIHIVGTKPTIEDLERAIDKMMASGRSGDTTAVKDAARDDKANVRLPPAPACPSWTCPDRGRGGRRGLSVPRSPPRRGAGPGRVRRWRRPGAGARGPAGHQLAVDTRTSYRGSRTARIGLGLGELVGGLYLTVTGAAGEAGGGVLVASGPGAAAGVPLIAISTVAVVGGAANVSAGAKGVVEALQSRGSGGGKSKADAEVRGGRGRFKEPEDAEEQLRSIEEAKARTTPNHSAEEGDRTKNAIQSTEKSKQRMKDSFKDYSKRDQARKGAPNDD